MINIRNEEERTMEVDAVKIGQALTGRKTPPERAIIEKLKKDVAEQIRRVGFK